MIQWTDREIHGWLEEQLPGDRLAAFESQLRNDSSLRARVSVLIRMRDQGGNTIGEIWQRARLSCPSRSELGSYLLQAMPQDELNYIQFHLQTVGCRLCQANLRDLEEQSAQMSSAPERRRRFFESSAGLLRERRDSSESQGDL